jgi:hypothetical protein
VRRIAFVAMAGALALDPLQAQGTTADFSHSPVTTGSWTYRAVAGGSEASFVDGSGQARMVIACGRVTRLVTLSRISAAPASSISIWTSSATRDLASRFDQNARRVIAQVAAADPLLDAIVSSRGRIGFTVTGQPSLVVPAWAEAARVIEDCRA